MSSRTADVVICGAGIAGVSIAYQLAAHHNMKKVILIDERPPLSLTSDKSTECYRNWWPGPGEGMVRLMDRSIDLLETIAHQTGNRINLNRRGYVFATANPDQVDPFRKSAQEASSLGAGPLRVHDGGSQDEAYVPAPAEGFEDLPTGADLIIDSALLRQHFPYLSPDTVAVLHPRRAGWFSAQQLGSFFLDEARANGAELVEGRLEEITLQGGGVIGVKVHTSSGVMAISTERFVNAAGPFQGRISQMLGIELPVYNELHAKISFEDHQRAVPRDAGLLIWTDPVELPWSEEERQDLMEDEDTRWLLEEFPGGVHARPDGPDDSPIVLLLWTYELDPVEPVFPPPFDETYYPEIALRGMSAMLPALKGYFGKMPRPTIDGGYYAKTRENRPLFTSLPVKGAYLIGALSGFGLMVSSAGSELLAARIMGDELPDYAHWFSLERYQDPAYLKLLDTWESTGQL